MANPFADPELFRTQLETMGVSCDIIDEMLSIAFSAPRHVASTTISEKAVKVAYDAYLNCEGINALAAMLSALIAAAPFIRNCHYCTDPAERKESLL